VTGSLGISLGITAIGMTLLFGALAFFYGLLTLMTSVMQERRLPPGPQAAEGLEPARMADKAGRRQARLRAAAIAVALARATAEGAATRLAAPEETGQVSAWWSLHHQRSLQPGARRRR
jgi:hypothetical protein